MELLFQSPLLTQEVVAAALFLSKAYSKELRIVVSPLFQIIYSPCVPLTQENHSVVFWPSVNIRHSFRIFNKHLFFDIY